MMLEHSLGWAFRTLDGAGTFHGMGIIGAATPHTKQRKAIRREVTATLETASTIGKVLIPYFDASVVDLLLAYKAVLLKTKARCLPWMVSWPLSRLVSDDAECMRWDISWSEYFSFLPMIDMDPTNVSCVFLLSSLALRYGATPVRTFDQSLWWKATMVIDNEPHDCVPRSIVLRVGGFYTEMSSLGCMGRLKAGSGLQQLLEAVFAQNSVTHMLTGKAIARAVRWHFFADVILNAELYRARVAPSVETYRSVQTDYASVWCKNTEWNAAISRILPGCIASNHTGYVPSLPTKCRYMTDHLWNTSAKTKQPGNLITS